MTRFLGLLLLAASLSAQEHLPLRTGVILLGDRFGDQVWALNDFDFDFTTEQPGECVPWYTSQNGPVLATIQDIAVSEDGRAFVVDSTGDQIVWLLNKNLDQDANDPGESGVFFDLTNAAGIQVGSPLGLAILKGSPLTIYLAASGSGSVSADRLVLMSDLDGDGDANDAAESHVFFDNQVSLGSGNPDIANPAAVAVDDGGRVFILHSVTVGASAGVYELVDMNGDQDANDPGEVIPYFILPSSPPAAFDMAFGRDGRLYVSDRGTPDAIYVLQDMNGDGDVADVGEAFPYWTATLSSLVDNICEYVLPDGNTVLLLAEDGGDDRVLMLYDMNGNGVIDAANEEITLHNTANPGVVDFGQPKAIEALPGPSLTGPATLAVGQSTTAFHQGVQGQTLFVGYSFASGPISAPPYGIYWLGTYPPLGYSVPFAIVPATGTLAIPFSIPNFPWLAGLTIDCQSYEYDGFFGRLSQRYSIAIM